MTVAPLTLPSVPAFDSATLVGTSGPSLDAALQDFEGLFVSLMLKEMRKSVGKGFFGGDTADAIGGLFDLTLGEELGRSGTLGIAAALERYREIAQTELHTNDSGAAP